MLLNYATADIVKKISHKLCVYILIGYLIYLAQLCTIYVLRKTEKKK